MPGQPSLSRPASSKPDSCCCSLAFPRLAARRCSCRGARLSARRTRGQWACRRAPAATSDSPPCRLRQGWHVLALQWISAAGIRPAHTPGAAARTGCNVPWDGLGVVCTCAFQGQACTWHSKHAHGPAQRCLCLGDQRVAVCGRLRGGRVQLVMELCAAGGAAGSAAITTPGHSRGAPITHRAETAHMRAVQ